MFNFLSEMIAGMTKISVSFSSFFQKTWSSATPDKLYNHFRKAGIKGKRKLTSKAC
jgi:hypothetical protein